MWLNQEGTLHEEHKATKEKERGNLREENSQETFIM